MIFVGDIALPFEDALKVEGLPLDFFKKNWFGNLEGAIIDNVGNMNAKSVVFNDKRAISSLTSQFNYSGFALANNHIFDTGSLEETTKFLNELDIPYGGIGINLEEANKPILLSENGRQIVILNFGWEVIQCEITTGGSHGVNPLRKDHVISSLKEALIKFPDAVIIPFMHWSYELEAEPQPFERELAKHLIDLGAEGVIGAHPHRIGGFEQYKGKPILYSLGNWMFRQNYFRNGKSRFPSFCDQQLAFEWDFNSGDFLFHFFEYDKASSTIVYKRTEDRASQTINQYTPFNNLSDDEYKSWYKKHHFHKSKGLPIYYWNDSLMQVAAKNKINKLRDRLIHFVSKIR